VYQPVDIETENLLIPGGLTHLVGYFCAPTAHRCRANPDTPMIRSRADTAPDASKTRRVLLRAVEDRSQLSYLPVICLPKRS